MASLHYNSSSICGPILGPLLKAVHQATLDAGAVRTLCSIKVASAAQAGGPSVDGLGRKFRK